MREDVKNFEGLYKADSDGYIYSVRTQKALKPAITNGYEMVTLTGYGMKKNLYVHKLILEAFKQRPEDDIYEVDHINGIKTDNRLENLQYLTHCQNCRKSTAGIKKPERRKAVIDLRWNEVYECPGDCAEAVQVSSRTVYAHCEGHIKKQRFAYIDEYFKNEFKEIGEV